VETFEFEHDDECAEIIQKQESLYKATQKLDEVISTADGFGCFDSEEDKEEKLERIRQNPEAILSSSEKSFMKKIANAMMDVDALTKEVEEAKKKMRDLQSDKQVHAAFAKAIEAEAKANKAEAKVTKLKSKVTELTEKVNAMDETLKKQEEMMREQKKYYQGLIDQQRAYMDSKVEALSKHLAEQAKQAEEMKQQFAEWMTRREDKPKGLLSFGGKGAAK
jgi:DNA repair exonuclease SbcCD ATPase subunit